MPALMAELQSTKTGGLNPLRTRSGAMSSPRPEVHGGDEDKDRLAQRQGRQQASAGKGIHRPDGEDRCDECGDDGRIQAARLGRCGHAFARAEEPVPPRAAEDDGHMQQRHQGAQTSRHGQRQVPAGSHQRLLRLPLFSRG